MNTRRPYELTPQDLALAQARKEKKLKQALEAEAVRKSNALLSRKWITISQDHSSISLESNSITIKILTWNLLAQCLIRRELFPTSDCLKVAQREPLIHEEIQRQDAQIICLQEVDQLEKLLPVLDNAGYIHHYAAGYRKKHGCLIAFKKDLFSLISDKTIFYDDQPIGTVNGRNRIGGTFRTRNIGYMLALKSRTNENEGVIVATTHLFWHPRYFLVLNLLFALLINPFFECAILIRETIAFKELHSANGWPCILAGDYNFAPNDPAYSLLTGDSLLSSQKELIIPSMVVHSSLDPVFPQATLSSIKTGEEDEGDEIDPDRDIVNARAAVEADELLSIQEIIEYFSELPKLRSIYADGLCDARKYENNIRSYGDRVPAVHGRNGANEPEYTSYTHYWQAVLDYIFVLEPSKRPVCVKGLLEPLTEKDMIPGLPQKHVSGSDHTCLVAELAW
ncbi:Endonuclease/exonuclease/phosphatase [Pholiota conissans]|uniref:Endonuclease/exonuclease/phosphatase n=1 Tax=Pholiota conissans TaxID=109636 RepID=A0A9P6CN61_9AGAR|nr:Endonuclease/exonuclease/phosphatase [Pholiota conissans]